VTGWPAVRTSPEAMRAAGLRPFLWAAGTMLLLPLLCGAALLALGSLMPVAPEPSARAIVEGMGLVLVTSGIITAPVAALAVPLSYVAARRGYGGWAVALLGAVVLGGLAMGVLAGRPSPGTMISGAAYGLPFGLLYWLGARLGAPLAFATEAVPDQA